jgi:hypothetical protein
MNVLKRTLIILVVALVVVGGVVAAARMGWLNNIGVGEGREFRPDGPQFAGDGEGGVRPQFDEGGFPDGDFRGRGERGGSLFGIGELIKNLVIVVSIFIAVVAVSLFWRGSVGRHRNRRRLVGV